MSAEKKRSEQRKEEIKNSVSDFDALTGQPLYKPITGRPPKNRSKLKSESIGDYLYSLNKKSSLNSSAIQEKSETLDPEVSMVQYKSNQLVDKLRKDCFCAVFGLLDTDSDGVISTEKVAVDRLPKKIAAIYIPLIRELQEMNCTLNLEEFLDASNNLFKELNVAQKNDLLNFHKLKSSARANRSLSCCECSFKPCISQKSRELADKKAIPGVDLPTKLFHMKKVSNAKIERMRRKSEDAKLEECSFRPQISPIPSAAYNSVRDPNFISPIRYFAIITMRREIYGRLLGREINKSFEEPEDS